MGPKIKPKAIINALTSGKPNIDQMPLISIDELTTPFSKVDEQDLKNYLIDQGRNPDDVNFFMNTHFYPSADMYDKLPSTPVKTETRGAPLQDIDKKDAQNIFSDYKIFESKLTTPLKESGKSVNEIMLQDYTGRIPTKPKSDDPRIIINKSHSAQSLTRRDEDVVRQLNEVVDKDGFIPPEATIWGSMSNISSTRDVDNYVKKGKDRFKSSQRGAISVHSDFIVPTEYQYMVDFKETFPYYKQAGEITPFSKHHQGFLTSTQRNTSYHKHYEGLLFQWLTEQKLIKKAYKDGKIDKTRYDADMKDAKDYIKFIVEDMKKLGLETKVWNKNKKGFDTYGKKYGDKQLSTLYKDQKKTYDLNIPPQGDQLLSQHRKNQIDALEILREKRKNNDMSGTGVKPEGHEEGGLVRPNMSLGGDMSQYAQMESVVPDLNVEEAEDKDYVQLAMSFKNPFKIKKQPPLMTDVDTTLKISDQGPGTTKTATQTHTVDAGVGSDSIFYLKSDLELANAAQNKMTGQQWLGYLTKKGVSPTELDEFGLKNLLYNLGGWDESTKKWTNNKAISKSDLIAAYKNEKPVISYKIHQIEPFEKGVKDFVSFLTKRKSGGSYYHGEKGMDEIRGLLNKPQDIAGDTLRLRLSEVLSKTGDVKKDWPMYEKGMITDINKIFKQFYGIDNVVENGIPKGKNIPFYSRNILERFNRLRKGEGFYFAKGKGVQHEGTQFMPGGTGYIEIPFTYNPNPKGKRANEPAFTFGEGHFTNPEGNNPVFWLRASERTDEQGKRILFIEEIQSDMHQKVKQKPDTFSYAKRQDSPGMIDTNMALKQFDNLKIELGKVTDQIDKITGHTDPSAATIMERLKVKREAIRTQMEELQNSIKEAGKRNENVFPEGPFKKSENQTKVALKALINLATKEGFDGVAIVTGKAKNKFASASGEVAKGNLGFYDGIAVKAMKNVAKNLDLDFSATNIKDGDGNTWAKIPLINLKEATVNKSVDLYKAEGGYIHRPSFVDVIPTL